MHQRKYTLELISELGLRVAKLVSTHCDTNVKLTTKEYDDNTCKDEIVFNDPLVDQHGY